SKDVDKLRTTYNIYEYIYYMAIIVVYSIAAIVALPFISLYTEGISDIQYVNPLLAFLFVIRSVGHNLRMPGSTIITAAGHFQETQWRSILESFINLSASFILI